MTTKQPVPFAELVARVRSVSARKDSLIGLLPIFEHKYSQVQTFEDVAALRLPELVAFTLAEGSSYWISLALGWLESGFPISDALREELLSVSHRAKLEQSIRHRAYALHHKKA